MRVDDGATAWVARVQRHLGAEPEIRIVLAGPEHVDELVDVREVDSQRRAGEHLRQVEPVALADAESLSEELTGLSPKRLARVAGGIGRPGIDRRGSWIMQEVPHGRLIELTEHVKLIDRRH